MITLKRKTTAPVIETRDGVQHPDLIMNMDYIQIDLVNQRMVLRLNYYHSQAAKDSGHRPIRPEEFNSSLLQFTFTPDSNPSFSTVYNMFTVDANGPAMTDPTTVETWILNRRDPAVSGGDIMIALNENWEIPV